MSVLQRKRFVNILDPQKLKQLVSEEITAVLIFDYLVLL